MKKILLVLVICIFTTFVFASCFSEENVHTGNDSVEDEENSSMEDSDLKEEQIMFIGGWNDPQVSEEQYKQLAESGINHIFINRAKPHSQVLKIMEYCDKYDIKVIVVDRANNKVTYNNDYMKHPSFEGVDFQDEPVAGDFKRIEKEVSSFEEIYKGKLFYVNLFPDPTADWEKRLGTSSWEEYVDLYCEKILSKVTGRRMLSFDVYPLCQNERGTFIEERYLPNLEYISHKAKEYNADAHVYIQAQSYQSYVFKRSPSFEDIKFQFYTAMAMGFNSMTYFCYHTPGPGTEFKESDLAIVDREGNKTKIYDYVKKMNEEMFAFDDVFLTFKHKGTKAIYGEKDPDAQSAFMSLKYNMDHVNGIKDCSSTYDALIGYYENGSEKGYMITNFTDPSYNQTNKVTINGIGSGMLYRNGVPKKINGQGNKLEITLAPGEGVFLVC